MYCFGPETGEGGRGEILGVCKHIFELVFSWDMRLTSMFRPKNRFGGRVKIRLS